MRTNAARADKAYHLVRHYESDSSLEECLSDLLGDLRHFCDKYGIDFAERDTVGHRNYLHEFGQEKVRQSPLAATEYEDPEAGGMSTSDGLGA